MQTITTTDIDQINATVRHAVAWLGLCPETEGHARDIAALGRIDTIDSARAARAIAFDAFERAGAAYVSDESARDAGLYQQVMLAVMRSRPWSDRMDEIAHAQWTTSASVHDDTVMLLDALSPFWHRVTSHGIDVAACLAARRDGSLNRILATAAALA